MVRPIFVHNPSTASDVLLLSCRCSWYYFVFKRCDNLVFTVLYVIRVFVPLKNCNVSDLFLRVCECSWFYVWRMSFVRRCCVYCLLCRNFCYGPSFALFFHRCVFVRLSKYLMAQILYSKGWKRLVGTTDLLNWTVFTQHTNNSCKSTTG